MKVRLHCNVVSKKVCSLFAKLGRQAGRRWGLRFSSLSLIYRGVFAPTVAYAAAGWTDLCTKGDLGGLRSLQRRALISVTTAYRTVSAEALCVTAGAVPIDILFAERRARYAIRHNQDVEIGNRIIAAATNTEEAIRDIKEEAMQIWQTRWSSSGKGRITYAFFKSVQERVDATWVRPYHGITQMITGHGNFRTRLAIYGITESGMCTCGEGEDTVAHHILDCKQFEPQREALRQFVPAAAWKWPDVAPFLVTNPETYSTFADFCRLTHWLKRCGKD